MNRLDKWVEELNDTVNTLSHSYDDEQSVYEIEEIDSHGKNKKLISRKQYIQFLIDCSIDSLMNVLDEIEEYQDRRKKIKAVN